LRGVLGAEEGGGAEGGEGGGFEEVAAGEHGDCGLRIADCGETMGKGGPCGSLFSVLCSLFSVLGLRRVELGERLAERRGAEKILEGWGVKGERRDRGRGGGGRGDFTGEIGGRGRGRRRRRG
jgi:hypothetical protein